MSETPAASTEKPATPSPAPAPAAKPAAPKPAAPKPGEPSPNATRPGVVFGGIATLKIEDIVVPFDYVVRSGETMESIAKLMYGSRKKAILIRDANPALGGNAQPTAGQKLKIPKA